MTWTPITIEEIYDMILATERDLNGELLNFWELIKIYPEKWNEETYGKEGNGFWVVGLIGRRVIYFNDIEEGFNISDYKTYGTIDYYFCNQDKLVWAIQELFDLIKSGGHVQGQAGPPINLRP
jgi:site-specific DNA-adenine methylase